MWRMHTAREIEKIKEQFGVEDDDRLIDKILMEMVDIKTKIDLLQLENASMKKQTQRMEQMFEEIKKETKYWQIQARLLRTEMKKNIRHILLAFGSCCIVLIAGTMLFFMGK